jgi:hypothetical protein
MEPNQTERRHRIHGEEVEVVEEGLRLLLLALVNSRDDFDAASTAFKVLFRLTNHRAGNPGYPDPITWEEISDYLS